MKRANPLYLRLLQQERKKHYAQMLLYITQLKARIGELEVECDSAMNKWQPIETAPRDGTSILCWVKDNKEDKYYISTASWAFNNWLLTDDADGYGSQLVTISHWQPLPQPPMEKSDET